MIKKTAIALVLCLLVIYFFNLHRTANKWRKYYSPKEIKTIAEVINKTKNHPEKLYEAYDKMHPNCRFKSMFSSYNEKILSALHLNNSCCDPFYQRIYFYIPSELRNKKMEYPSWSLGWGIRNYTSNQNCFDYYLNNVEVKVNNKNVTGVDSISARRFGKSIVDLSELEINDLFNLIKL
ncbi:MAG TPA: hypothetical protein PKN75_12655 [Bacteroidia bacterium]|nr:hypothetical protein [Bacteroidia bacterium]